MKKKHKKERIGQIYLCPPKEQLKVFLDCLECGETSQKTIYYYDADMLKILVYQESYITLSCSEFAYE